MGHREELLAGAVKCLREKGYARTTARDIVAASGTNLGSIGYHYGSTENLLNAAVLQAIHEFGAELAAAVGTAVDPQATALQRFHAFWSSVLGSFAANRQIWRATFDTFTVAERVPDIRAAIVAGLEDGRLAWAHLIHGLDPDEPVTRAVGSLHQALLSGVLVQWLIDPDHAPSADDLTAGLRFIATDVASAATVASGGDAAPAGTPEPKTARRRNSR